MEKRPATNLYRRNFLKLLGVGAGGFVLGRLADPLIELVRGEKIISEKDFKNFKFEETNKELRILDQSGEEIIIVDKDTVGG
jgi:hypothetical protein